MKVACPTCHKDVVWQSSSVYRPFCSKRCQMIDLGEWADENHAIPAAPLQNPHDMTDEELEAFIQKQNKT